MGSWGNGQFVFKILTACLLSMAAIAAPSKEKPGTPSTQTPRELEGVGIEQKLGEKLNLQIPFKDENGQEVLLASYFDGKHPVVISPVYYSCPGLCNYHLNGLVEGLKELEWTPGQNFKVLAVSFDPKENSELALAKKQSYMQVLGKAGAENGFHFLTGSQESIDQLTAQIGFKYKWNEEAKEWAHGSAAIIASPQGVLSRYLPGIYFKGQDLKLALNEAAQGKIGTFVDKLVLFCFSYDSHQSKYTLAVSNIMKLGGGLTILVLAIWLTPFWWRARRKKMNEPVAQ